MAERLSPRVRARLGIRDAVAAVLAHVPLEWLEWARRSAAVPSGTTRTRALTALLEVLRHRPLKELETISMVDEPGVVFHNTGAIMLKRIYWFGSRGHEGDEVRIWQAFCRRANAILEIGANIGVYTVMGRQAAGPRRYTAVEPHPASARALRANLELNGIDDVQVVEAAVVA